MVNARSLLRPLLALALVGSSSLALAQRTLPPLKIEQLTPHVYR